MKKLILALFLTSLAVSYAYASGNNDNEEISPYKYPVIKPTLELSAGYAFIDSNGSKRAGEFEYLKDSIAFGGKVIAFPFPHRLHLEIDFLNGKDYFGDLSYAYKDIVLARWISRVGFHNLENITLVDLGADSNYTVSSTDAGKKYGIKTGLNTAFLRFKMPDFPLHLYVDSGFIDKEGSRQQRFLWGSAYFDNMKRTSRERNIDWHTTNVTVGINSHLGPLEADFSHSEMRFNNGGDKLFSDFYSAAAGRGAGTYPHNLVPEIEGSSNTFKLHTSYTGQIVGSATLSWADRKNNESGANADYFYGQGEITWMPLTRVTLFLRYRHMESDVENPDVLPAGYLGFASYTAAITGIKDSISTTADTVSATVRYRPTKDTTFRVKYSYERQDRNNALEWAIDEVMRKNTLTVSADTKVVKTVKLALNYEHQETDNPAYNIQPNRSDSGTVSVTWNPHRVASLFLSYSRLKEQRNDISYSGMEATTDAKDRDAERDKVAGTITLMLSSNASLTAGYTYYKNSIEQDLIYNDFSNSDELDKSANYKDTAHNYALSLSMRPTKRTDLTAGISHTRATSKFSPGISDAQNPVSIGSFAEMKTKETEYSLSGGYEFKQGWRAGIRYKYARFDDMIENPDNPEVSDGEAQTVLLTLTRRWQ